MSTSVEESILATISQSPFVLIYVYWKSSVASFAYLLPDTLPSLEPSFPEPFTVRTPSVRLALPATSGRPMSLLVHSPLPAVLLT